MDVSKNYSDFALKISGKWIEKNVLRYFKPLHEELQRADIRKPLLEYACLAVVTTIFVFFFQTIAISLIMTSFYILGVPLLSWGLGLLMGVVGGVISAILIFVLFYIYPSIKTGERKKNIDDSLPFATLYLATIAGSGAPPITMFRTLAKFKEYGEISNVAQRVTQEVDVMGTKFIDALEHAARRTPSESFSDLLWGMRTVITSGGNLKNYLHDKSNTLIQDYRRRLKDYANQLSLYTEMYTTVIIVASIFFMIMLTIMGIISGSGESMQRLIVAVQLIIVFIGLPVASAGFLVVAKGISPKA